LLIAIDNELNSVAQVAKNKQAAERLMGQ